MRFSKIDDKLSVYQGKNVVIWGTSSAGELMYGMLKGYSINVVAFCDSNSTKWGKEFLGLPIRSPETLQEIPDVLVQIGSSYELEIEEKLLEYGIKDYIMYRVAKKRLLSLEKYLAMKNNDAFREIYIKEIFSTYVPYFERNFWAKAFYPGFFKRREFVCLLMPPKTGNNTLDNTLREYGDDKGWLNCEESATWLKYLLPLLSQDTKIKLVTAVREPIGQNLSMLYETANFRLWDQEAYWEEGGNLEKLFSFFIQEERFPNEGGRNSIYRELKKRWPQTLAIQNFFEREFLGKLEIDLLSYPFDKEKGYSVIQEGQMEIFIYQLEKLNEIQGELFQYLELEPEAELCMGNVAAEKYYKSSYEEAKKQLMFSREYFEWSFASPYVSHFYSEEDIVKLKKHWESHIL